MLVYKIFRTSEWVSFNNLGTVGATPDGFVHLSTAEQLPGTAAEHFAGADGLWLAAVDADRLGEDLRWEPSRGAVLFPHLYRDLRHADIEWSRPLPLREGIHVFPEGLA